MKKLIKSAAIIFAAFLSASISGYASGISDSKFGSVHVDTITCGYRSIPDQSLPVMSQAPIVPSVEEIGRPFGDHDAELFQKPPKVYSPETWFHYIGGNVAKEGIKADLEAIASAGFSGIQLFHGQFGGAWPGVKKQITCLSSLWDDAVLYTAEECRRLGLRFTMQNCPGWAMAGGPWINPENAMRHLVWSRTDVVGGAVIRKKLSIPQPSEESWRNYRDIAILAFPTPLDDTGEALKPSFIRSSNNDLSWEECLAGNLKTPLKFTPSSEANPHWVEVSFSSPVKIRTVEFPSINSLNHSRRYKPGVSVKVIALLPDGSSRDIIHTKLPQSNWQDDYPISFACSEIENCLKYRIEIVNKYDMSLRALRLFSGARKNSWESEAGWTLRSFERMAADPVQSKEAYVALSDILDLTIMMDKDGQLNWKAPEGKWTVLRIGHVNTGMRNAPAPPEGTGWECNKLSEAGSGAHFDGYIGRLVNGPLNNGLLNGLLLDSWECQTQTWTYEMEDEFLRVTGYSLRKWLPAVFGYVISDQNTTGRFLLDWRRTIGELFSEKFFGNMAKLARKNNLSITYETAAGDVFPADILEYFKHSDVPMCEFWQPLSHDFVGSLDFKPIKPTASAAHVYGKPRIAAEAFTSLELTWDEHLEMLKEVANVNSIEGVTHLVFHTYTHNPQVANFLPPGTSFGSAIGTPFLRGQTWWKYMPEFTTYLSRCSYLLERGKPVSDVLWYLGDEISHKPDQNAPFPVGFKYDYCNPDVLLNRLEVKDGNLVTPEGVSYRVLWIPDAPRMLPETLEKLVSLINDGATIIGNAPESLATLSGGKKAQMRFDKAVATIWKKKIGKGKVISGKPLQEALSELKLHPDVIGGDALWSHRRTEGADWYFICAPKGNAFRGTLEFNCSGIVEYWDPVTGNRTAAECRRIDERTSISLDLPRAGSCFIVFRHNSDEIMTTFSAAKRTTQAQIFPTLPWKLNFPTGWGTPESIDVSELKAWKNLNLSAEGKAFSGTATYITTFDIGDMKQGKHFFLDLGKVAMIAEVFVNGKKVQTLWASPYQCDISDYVKLGENELKVAVTSTWFNRLVYDASLPEVDRKTWTINGPSKKTSLRDSGLLGPVIILQAE